MKKGILVIILLLLLSAVCYTSFVLGEKYLLHASIEESKSVLRAYRAMNNSTEGFNDLRYRSIIDLDEPESNNARPNTVVAAVRVVQSKEMYVVLRANGSIEEFNGVLNDLL